MDDNPNLALRYNIRSIPNVKAFRDGLVVSEFLGVQPENRIKDFIHKLAPSHIDLLLEKGQSNLESMDWQEAHHSYRKFLDKSPGSPAGLLGLLKTTLMMGNLEKSKIIFDEFPPSPEYSKMLAIRPLYDALRNNKSFHDLEDHPFDAAFHNALLLTLRGNIPAAMDGFIDILRQDKHYRDDIARKVILALFEILGNDHQITQQYRQELALVLF